MRFKGGVFARFEKSHITDRGRDGRRACLKRAKQKVGLSELTAITEARDLYY